MKEELLRILENNSRIDLKELATMLGITEAEAANTIADLEKEGVICGYYTLINWENTDDEKVDAIIEVDVTPQRDLGYDALAERIYKYDEVKAVYLMSGGYDFMVQLEGKTMKGVASFVMNKLSTIEFVTGTTTHFVLKKYKDYGTILGEEKVDEREMIRF